MSPSSRALAAFSGLAFVALCTAANASIVTPDFVVPDSSIAQPSANTAHTDYVISRHLLYNAPAVTSDTSRGVPLGVKPAQLQSIYNISPAGQGAIALVDAYSFPTALSDFNGYSAAAGLPTEPSTSATSAKNTVFQVVYAGAEPPADSDWNVEEALDIEIAHAMAPGAKIYLVEAESASDSDLYYAVRRAAALPGVQEISMSWGGAESSNEKTIDSRTFPASSILYFASSGDSGAGAQYPAASPDVVSVGGTSLHFTKGVFSSETGWAYSGGGRSAIEGRPSYQASVTAIVKARRGIPDIAADANPNTGVGILVNGKWLQVGGTSVAAPMCAAFVNDVDSSPGSTYSLLMHIYGNLLTKNFRDIVKGNNGFPCLPGYDLVTGVGSPNGTGGL